MTQLIIVTDDSTRDDLITALKWLNATAKTIRRKGYTGTASAEYTRTHPRMDALLSELVP